MRALCEKYGVAYGYYGRVAEAEAIEEKFAGAEQLELSLAEPISAACYGGATAWYWRHELTRERPRANADTRGLTRCRDATARAVLRRCAYETAGFW